MNVAAHELRTPLQPILGLSDVLMHEITEPKEYELINIIARNAKRLQRLAENILDVTKIEGGTLKLRKERLNIVELISNVIKDYNTELAKEQQNYRDNNEITLSYNTSENFIPVEADSDRIVQVILNILDNATKFAKKNLHDLVISITVQKIDYDEMIVNIKDNGTGIDLQILPKLFTKFATKSQSGTGLGMFIAKNIIEAHGGKMWAKNNPDGNGATFTFTLPVSPQHG
ncbi:sensor histidine kinase [Nitrososphaera sp. AFS]|uniref:sensor histidine kinase n=1 Tax=Nitrososphaera sp. AFS TaxID=2301191 RepID=UPI00351BC942